MCCLSPPLLYPTPPHPAGALLSEATPVLVLPDSQAAAAAELAGLPEGPRSATVLRLVALVLRCLEEQRDNASAFAAQYPPQALARIGAAAQQMLHFAERAGWPALAALLRPAVMINGGAQAAAAAVTMATAAAYAPSAEGMKGCVVAAAEVESAPGKEPFEGAGRGIGKVAQGGGGGGGARRLASLVSDNDRRQRVMQPQVLGAMSALLGGGMLVMGALLLAGGGGGW